MTREELFEAWAPAASPWSTWAKPVLFAQAALPIATSELDLPDVLMNLTWAPMDSQTALVIDIPGTEAVKLVAALTNKGFRPVPLFNGVGGPSAVVPLEDTLRSLVASADALNAARLPESAPPAFLLDSRRMPSGSQPRPGQFDNRWLVFPQDFPSGAFLLSRGITAVVQVRASEPTTPADLAHVLLRWKEAGLRLYVHVLANSSGTQPLSVTRPSGFRSLAQRVGATFGLCRNSTGGFGAVIPIAATGGGFG